MKIADIKPYPKNAKKHPPKHIQQIADSIKAFGMHQPIVVDKDGVIIVGHGRYEACKLLGIEPEIKVVDLSEEQAKAYRLADNKLNESEWDMNLVIEELQLLSPEMLDLTGFDSDLLITPDEKDDQVPDVPEEPVSKLGDFYELGQHRVLCGDSTQHEAVSALMGGKKADMVFTDPPYGVDYLSRVDKDRRKPWGEIVNDNLNGTALVLFLRDSVGELPKPKYICCNWQSVKDFFEALGMPNSLIVWDKKSVGLGANYRSQHEFILFYGKLNHRNETNVWSLKRDTLREYAHPTQKPVELIVRAILNSSEQGGVVYDAFLGSGSTLIACQKTGRICFGNELEPRYVDVIISRYCQYVGNNEILKNGEKIVWEDQKNK